LGFLNEINEERIFQRHYRDIAAQLCLEIEKPSRRFKVTEEQIRNKANAPTRQQHTRLRRQESIEENDDSSIEDSVEDGES
jgi:hypothetical protein